MTKRIATLLSVVAVAAMLQAPAARAQQDCSNTSGGALLGMLGGAALGGFLGNKLGGSIGTGVGVFAGGLLGNQLGKALTCQDRQQAAQTTTRALETQPSGTTSTWSNPDTGNSGTVTPMRTFQRPDGTYCREFQQTITVGGKQQEAYGTACRQPDGSWKVVEN